MKEYTECAREMLEFIDKSPTCFQTVKNIGDMLSAAGFAELREADEWKLEKGKGYFVTRNESSVIAFRLPEQLSGFHIAAAHSDSPSFKVKESPESTVEEHYVRLNTEKYGGMILSTWLDRALSVAGRIAVNGEKGIETRLVNVDKDLLVIPNVAIHMNRDMNNGVAYNPQVDMLPLFADCSDGEKRSLMSCVAEAAGVNEEDIMLRIIFFDRYDEKAESVILRGRDNYFKPSIQTHSYRIELINGGIHRFVFHSIILKEVSQEEFDAEQERIEKLKRASKKGKTLRRENKKSKG